MPKYLVETELQKRVEKKIEEIANDYDLENMKANDMETLKALAFAQIQLSDIEVEIFKAQKDGRYDDVSDLQKIASSVRNDIIKFQNTLGITRKSREDKNESSVAEFIADLKKRASKLYDREMIYLYCPVTHKLLGTCWISNKRGKHQVNLWCEDCQKRHFFNPATLAKKKKRNSIDDVPDGM